MPAPDHQHNVPFQKFRCLDKGLLIIINVDHAPTLLHKQDLGSTDNFPRSRAVRVPTNLVPRLVDDKTNLLFVIGWSEEGSLLRAILPPDNHCQGFAARAYLFDQFHNFLHHPT